MGVILPAQLLALAIENIRQRLEESTPNMTP